jgi:hypothetical protein
MKSRTIATVWLALSLSAGAAMATEPVAVAVADFDYTDTSGEIADQVEAHRARVAAFGQLLRDSLVADGNYRVVRLDCPVHPCTAASMPADDFVAEARRAGARLVVYGGIRKMSTLVQWGEVQLVDPIGTNCCCGARSRSAAIPTRRTAAPPALSARP